MAPDPDRSHDQLVERARRTIREHDIEIVIAGAADLNGVFRGKRVPAERFLEHPLHPVLVSDYFWAMDTEENVIPPEPGYQGWWPSWQDGFGGVAPIPDLSSLRIAPWLDRTAVVQCDHRYLDGRPVEIAPRAVLRRVLDRATSLGVVPKFAAELEYPAAGERGLAGGEGLSHGNAAAAHETTGRLRRLPRHDRRAHPAPAGAPPGGVRDPRRGLEPGGRLRAIRGEPRLRRAARGGRARVPVKHAVKEIAPQHDLTASFMAKTFPGFGSSCHLQQSLWSPEGENLFWAQDEEGNLSELGRSFVAGQVATMREATAILAPTLNSYKRLTADSAAGTTATCGFENRTTGLRILSEHSEGCRVENRVPGGDVNPYLAMAACLAGGLYGVERKMEPPPPVSGTAYGDPTHPALPGSLEEATAALEAGEVMREYLGEEFLRFFAATRRWELEQFRAAVTDWEIRPYLQFL